MKGLQITLFIIAFIILSTQSFRHVYVKWIEPTGSVLDKYNEEVEKDIESSKTLDELIYVFEEAHKKVEEYEADSVNREDKGEKKCKNDPFKSPYYNKWEKEPYKSEQKARQAIMRWESRNKMLFELYFYWFCGLLSIIIGILSYQRINTWLGISGIITGFSEMIWWTSPLHRAFGDKGIFEILLNTKLTLSVTSCLLLVILWLFSNKFLFTRTKLIT